VRIGLLTGGGDAPGLNAAIRAVVLAALERRWEVIGIRRGFGGLLGRPESAPLGPADVRGITDQGGTILGTTNRGDPFRWAEAAPGGGGEVVERDRSDEALASVRSLGLDAVIAIGGDGTLRIALDLSRKGLPVVGVPKTIDNDISGTAAVIGFDTAVTVATEAIDRLHSTAESHERVMVVEVMGRYAGWIALHAGLAGAAHAILIPEIPFDLDAVCRAIRRREDSGRRFAIVVAAEGAAPRGGLATLREAAAPGRSERLGGVGELVAGTIARETGRDTRSLTLGHLQRGGSPTTFDRLLGLRFGVAAVRAVAERRFGTMVSLAPPTVLSVPLGDALATPRRVGPDSDSLATARELGVCLGD
jgi:6-phosphofructokinase 1